MDLGKQGTGDDARPRPTLTMSWCDGCGQRLALSARVEIWVSTPAGLRSVATHVGCEDEAVEALIFKYGGGRRVPGPKRSRRRAT